MTKFLAFVLVVSVCGSIAEATCVDTIPADLLPIFLEETAHVPDWRESICATLRAESAFDRHAESFYRTKGVPCCFGLGQFAAKTWRQVAPTVGCGGVSRKDPGCWIRVTVAYMAELLVSRYCGRGTEEPWAISRACYNAGMGNIDTERKVCRMTWGCEQGLWYDSRELLCRRSESPCHETRTYVRRIRRFSGGE